MERLELFVKQLAPGIYLMDEGHQATGYFVVGEDKVCVIDTMNGFNDLVIRTTYSAIFISMRLILIPRILNLRSLLPSFLNS